MNFYLGIRNELISLLICILTGLILGFIFCPWIDTYGVNQWPTNEMVSRGQVRSLLVGILIAMPSGAGVALSVLGNNFFKDLYQKPISQISTSLFFDPLGLPTITTGSDH